MNYSTLEDAYGSTFKQRAPVTQNESSMGEPLAKPEFTSLEKRSEESIRKNKSLVDSLEGSLGLDTNVSTENFTVRQKSMPSQETNPFRMGRENFVESQPADFYQTREQADKLSRILRLVEQNRTGYERAAVQDIALYVFTGVFFLFTFDTFVELGKSIR